MGRAAGPLIMVLTDADMLLVVDRYSIYVIPCLRPYYPAAKTEVIYDAHLES